jgi:hypothetical protein
MTSHAIVAETGIRDESSPLCLLSIRAGIKAGGRQTDANGNFSATFFTTGDEATEDVSIPDMIEIHIEFSPGQWRCREVPLRETHRVTREGREVSIDLGIIDVDYDTCRKATGR